MSFFKKKHDEDKIDWRDLDALPTEIVSKEDLDALQREVVAEIESIQREAIAHSDASGTQKPQSLFYYHKYIDSKFNKGEFDIDTYFTKKQNIIDRKYAEGVSDLREEFTGYKELIEKIREVDSRLRRKINKLDPTSNKDLTAAGVYDDTDAVESLVNSIPEDLDWNNLERSEK